MIKLVVNPDTLPQVRTFNGPIVTIGSESSADLPLPNEQIKALHIRIQEIDGRLIVTNIANDPFATINNYPFGKKAVTEGDLLQIGNTLIRFETISTASSPKPLEDKIHQKQEVHINQQKLLPNQLETYSEPSPEKPHPQETIHEEIIHNASAKKPPIIITNSSDSEESSSPEEYIIQTPRHPLYNRKLLVTIPLSILLILSIIVTAIYIKSTDKSEEYRSIAAEGVADVAMALTYARFNHIKPQKQNWIDPEFLTNNLASILSPEYPSFAYIEQQGQFKNCPYFLRIYTNVDLSQFLIIAQPSPNLFQWFISQATIVVDSQSMELHKIYDLKVLNRLLVNAHNLDGERATEVFHLIQQSELVPLSSLGSEKGFSPPKALTLIRPGAENRIYNAPRYYHFGETVLKKALALFQMIGNSHEVMRLQQQISELSKFQDIILYSSQGFQKASQAQKALSLLTPENKLLTAYLSFNKNGTIASSHLLFDADSGKTAKNENKSFDPSPEIPSANQTAMIMPDTVSKPYAVNQSDLVELHHPLMLQLTMLAHERQQALKSISDQLIALLNRNDMGKEENFNKVFSHLKAQYEELDMEWQKKMTLQLEDLYREYLEMPLAQFAAYVKAAGLEILAQETLREQSQKINSDPKTNSDSISTYIQKIGNAKNLTELDRIVTEASNKLNLAHIPDSNKVIAYQNAVRAKTAIQLGRFLLSRYSPLTEKDFREENRSILSHILKMAWITDQEEYGYYLNEFDLLMENK